MMHASKLALALAAVLVVGYAAGCHGEEPKSDAGAGAGKEVASSGSASQAAPADDSPGEIVTLPSGLKYQILRPGTGKVPKLTDRVTVHYRGTHTDGTEFDSSYSRHQPATFAVSGVIRGWTEALQLMHEGAKWKLIIPPNLAYGERGAGGVIGPNETLIFEVELLKVG